MDGKESAFELLKEEMDNDDVRNPSFYLPSTFIIKLNFKKINIILKT